MATRLAAKIKPGIESRRTQMNLFWKLISSGWFWADVVLSVVGGVLVFWGLKLEKDAEPKENLDAFVDDIKCRKLRARLGWRLLMWGVAIEVVAALGISVISGLENAEANLASEKLKQSNLELQIKLQPRTITEVQITNFIFLTERIPKIPVRVDVGNGVFSEETCNYAYQIRQLLNQVKYTVPDCDKIYPMGVFNDPTRTFLSTDAPTDLVMFLDVTNLPFPKSEVVNGIKRTVAINGDMLGAYAGLYFAFKDAGISIGWDSKPEWVGTNHCEIFVRQKP